MLCLSAMEGSVTLKVKVRTFPSHGRARVNETILPMIGAKEGEALLLAQYPTVYDQKTKTVAVTGYGDKMVDQSVIMLSPEDMAALGVAEGDTISVIRKVTWTEKITKGAGKAGATVKEGAVKAGTAVKEGATKAGTSVTKGAKDAAEKVTPKKGDKEL
jgi:anaerobic selenocysteine-containing dehydrogenase